MNIDLLKKHVQRIDSQKDIEVVDMVENDFSITFTITNIIVSFALYDIIARLYPKSVFKITPSPHHHNGLNIIFSKKGMITEACLEECIQESIKNNKLMLGMTNFGKNLVDFDHFTHINIVGSNGYGKTSLLKYFALIEAIKGYNHNIFIDVKGVELKPFNKHSSTLAYAHTKTEIDEVLQFLILEVARREYLFVNAFKEPVENLAKYQEEKKKYDLNNELPDLRRINLFIDEMVLFISLITKISHPNHSFNSKLGLLNSSDFAWLFTKARTVGIRLITSSLSPYYHFPTSNSFSFSQIFTQVFAFGIFNGLSEYTGSSKALALEDGVGGGQYPLFVSKGSPIYNNNNPEGCFDVMMKGRTRLYSLDARVKPNIIQFPEVSNELIDFYLSKYDQKTCPEIHPFYLTLNDFKTGTLIQAITSQKINYESILHNLVNQGTIDCGIVKKNHYEGILKQILFIEPAPELPQETVPLNNNVLTDEQMKAFEDSLDALLVIPNKDEPPKTNMTFEEAIKSINEDASKKQEANPENNKKIVDRKDDKGDDNE